MSLKSRGIFKKFLPVFLLLIIVTVVCVPFREAKALDLISFNIFDIVIDFITDAATDEDNKFFGVIYWLAYRVISLGLYATTILVYFGAWLVDVFLDENIYKSVLNMEDKTSAVYIGWTTVRDACNTFFILFLLLIAFSTILRIQTYSAKSLLPKFIISLFLINFSAVIAMMVIDFGQVFMFEIKDWMGAGGFSAPSGAGSPLTTIVDYFHNEYGWHQKPPHDLYNMSAVVGVAFAVTYSTILGLMYIMLALFLMVRIIVFVILVIISPFAFFSIILPGMRTYTSQWWQGLVSHALFGPIFLFFIFLSGKMAQSMETFNSTVDEPEDMKPLSYIIAKLIPHVVALGMLAAAIPVTQKLGVAGASKIIGGTAGLGKIGANVIGATKLAGGGAKKLGGGTVGRAHSALKGGSKWYNKKAQSVGGAIKSLPIVGRIKIESEVAKAQKNKEKVAEKEKLMDNMTDPDKKKYVDSFRLDKNAKAEAQQAMFNLMAKDSGKGLTNARLMKMGYEKDTGIKRDKMIEDKDGNLVQAKDKKGNVIQESVMKFDEEKFNKDYGRAAAHGMDTTNIEKYRPDLIKDKDDRIDKVRKTVADGDEKNIKLDVLLDEDIDKELQELIGRKRYKVLIDGKSQEEKDGLAKGKEDKLIRGMQIEKTQPGKKAKGALDITSKEGKEKLFEQQTEIAYLAGTKDKAQKMGKIKGINNDQSLNYEKDIDPEIARNVVKRMNSDDFVDQDPDFLEKTAYMIEDKNQFGRINKNKYVTPEQTEAIKKSISKRMGEIDSVADKEEYDRLDEAAKIMGCSITKPDKKKPDRGSGESGGGDGKDDNKRGGGKDQSTFDNFKGGRGSGGSDNPKPEGGGGGVGGSDKSGGADNSKKSFWKNNSGEAGLIGGEKNSSKGNAQSLSRQEVIEKIGETTTQVIDSLKEEPEEGLKKLDEIDNDWRKLVDENQEVFQTKGDNELTQKSMAAKQGMDGVRKVLRGKISGQGGNTSKKVDSNLEKGGVKKAVDSYMEHVSNAPVDLSPENIKKKVINPVARGMNKASIPIGKAEIAGLKGIGLVNKPVAAANTVVIPAINEGIKVNKRKLADPNLTNKQIRKEEIEKLKNVLKPAVSKNADEGVKVVGAGAGAALDKIGEGGGKLGTVAKVASKVVKNKQVQELASKKVKKLADQDKKVSIEGLEMKNIKEEYEDRKDMNRAGLGTKQIEVAQGLGKRGNEKNSVEVLNKLTKDKYAKKIVLDDKMNDINYKMAKAKKSGGSGDKEVKRLFEEKKKMAKEFVEETNPDLMKDINYEKGMIKKMRGANKKGTGRRLQAKRRGNLDQLKKEKQAKVDEVLGDNKGFRERKPVRIENKVKDKPQTKTVTATEKTNVETVKQTKSEDASKQWKINKDKEKIIETKESVSKDGLKSSVVKSEITFDPVKMGKKRAEQQVKEMIGGISSDMKQDINNNIAVNSPQKAIDIDFEKIIDTDKIAETIKKGINVDDVEKTFDDVKKSFKEFKGNNSGDASVPVFGAGISATKKAFEKASVIKDRNLTLKDRQARDVKLATIKRVMSEIKSGMNKQNKPSVNKEE